MKVKCVTCQEWIQEEERRTLIKGVAYHLECVPPGAYVQIPFSNLFKEAAG